MNLFLIFQELSLIVHLMLWYFYGFTLCIAWPSSEKSVTTTQLPVTFPENGMSVKSSQILEKIGIPLEDSTKSSWKHGENYGIKNEGRIIKNFNVARPNPTDRFEPVFEPDTRVSDIGLYNIKNHRGIKPTFKETKIWNDSKQSKHFYKNGKRKNRHRRSVNYHRGPDKKKPQSTHDRNHVLNAKSYLPADNSALDTNDLDDYVDHDDDVIKSKGPIVQQFSDESRQHLQHHHQRQHKQKVQKRKHHGHHRQHHHHQRHRLPVSLHHPPEYMVKLFHMLYGTHIDILSDTVVTSFANLNMHVTKDDDAMYHLLTFKTGSSTELETPQHAELRLYLMLKPSGNSAGVDQNSSGGGKKPFNPKTCVKISIFEVLSAPAATHFRDDHIINMQERNNESIAIKEVEKEGSEGEDHSLHKLSSDRLVTSRNITLFKSQWEGFDVKSEVNHWRRSKLRKYKVNIIPCGAESESRGDGYQNSSVNDSGRLDNTNAGNVSVSINSRPHSEHNAILIVFSKKNFEQPPALSKHSTPRIKREARKRPRLLNSPSGINNHANIVEPKPGIIFLDTTRMDNPILFKAPVKESRRAHAMLRSFHQLDQSGAKDHNRVNNLFSAVLQNISNLDDLAYVLDIADRSDTDEENLSLTQHSKMGSETNVKHMLPLSDNNKSRYLDKGNFQSSSIAHFQLLDSKKQRKVIAKPEPEEDMERLRRLAKRRYRRHHQTILTDTGSSSRVKRSRGSKRRRNSCRRVEMHVDFAAINWSNKIAFPAGYQAFQCRGKCYVPIPDHLTPTTHAIVQTLMSLTSNRRASRSCCVPTSLTPISVLIDQDGTGDTYTFIYSYPDMVVAQCGCR